MKLLLEKIKPIDISRYVSVVRGTTVTKNSKDIKDKNELREDKSLFSGALTLV